MKKLAVIFAGLSLFVATSCDDKDDPVIYYPIAGTWQPVKETWTSVVTGTDPVSDPIVYTPCQQESRWVFQTNSSGSIEDHDDPAGTGTCAVTGVRTFTYVYNGNGDDNFQIKYGGTVVPENGKVTKLTATEMNIKLEVLNNTTYSSKTYTFKRVQ